SQRFDCVVVVIADSAQGATQLAQSLSNRTHRVVNIASFLADFAGFCIAAFNHPQVGNSAQNRNQGGMGDQHDAFFVAVFKQIFVVLERLNVGGLYRHKHEHKAGAAHTHQVGVVL